MGTRDNGRTWASDLICISCGSDVITCADPDSSDEYDYIVYCSFKYCENHKGTGAFGFSHQLLPWVTSPKGKE